MKRLLKWFLLFNKRLYKKIAFVVILFSIPLLMLLMGIVSKQENGFVRIALCEQDGADSLAAEICDKLKNDSALIVFTKCGSAQEAERMVEEGEVNAAWVFCKNFRQRMNEFSAVNSAHDPVITVIEREQTTSLRLSHEKLASTLYKYCSRALYIDFIRTDLKQLDAVPQEELIDNYDSVITGEKLFEFETIDSSLSGDELTSTGYLLAPIRGLLSIVVMVCALAAALFYMQDEKTGTFAWVPYSKKTYVAFACQNIAVLNVSTVMLIALYMSGLGSSLARELIILLLFAIGCTVFCMLLQQIIRSIKVFCSLLPLLSITMIAVCPIFFNFNSLRLLQLIFPPTYYVRAVYNNDFLFYMVIYILCLIGLYSIVRRVLRR